MKLILITLLSLAISIQGFRLSENSKESVHEKCMKKYTPELAEVKKTLIAELQACKSSPNEKECSDSASAKATAAITEISEKLRQCIAGGGTNFNLINELDFSNEIIIKQYIKKYFTELESVK